VFHITNIPYICREITEAIVCPSKRCRYPPVANQKELEMNDINPGIDLSILDKANEVQDTYITNPNMKTVAAYIQALQETTMTLIDSILMLAGQESRKLMTEELKREPRGLVSK
jgi:hypothetical protein